MHWDLKVGIRAKKRPPLPMSETKPPVKSGGDSLRALNPKETKPPVTRGEGRQRAQQIGVGRSIIDQKKLPIFINLRQHRLDSLTEPRKRSVERGHEYADERLRSESTHLMTHRGQVLRTRAMFLKPLL